MGKKELLPEDTIIVWGANPANDYRKVFEHAIGKESAEKIDLFSHAGRTLKEALEEHLNPSGHKTMPEILSERRFDIISEPDKEFIIAFDKAITEFGYDFGGVIGGGAVWGRNAIVYGKTGVKNRPVIARIYIRVDGSIVLRLFIHKVENHVKYIETAPAHIKEVFTYPHEDCKTCGKNCRGSNCKEYSDGFLMRACSPDWYFKPSVEKVPDYMNLLSEFYPKKK